MLGKFSKEIAQRLVTEGMSERYNSWKNKTLDKIQEYKDEMINGDWSS
jgi:hypothetical protein